MKDVDIESQGKNYLVRGKIEMQIGQKGREQEIQENRIRMIWGKLRGQEVGDKGESQSPPSFVPLELRDTPEDIERLDREGRARGHNASGMPDSHSVSQILRTVGGYVDIIRARFVGVCWKDQSLIVPYEGRDDRRNVEELTISSLSDHCVHMYMRRADRN